jgi:hypothetical protein
MYEEWSSFICKLLPTFGIPSTRFAPVAMWETLQANFSHYSTFLNCCMLLFCSFLLNTTITRKHLEYSNRNQPGMMKTSCQLSHFSLRLLQWHSVTNLVVIFIFIFLCPVCTCFLCHSRIVSSQCNVMLKFLVLVTYIMEYCNELCAFS